MNRILQRLARSYDESIDYNGYTSPRKKNIDDFLKPNSGFSPSTYDNITQDPYIPDTTPLPKINKSIITLTELKDAFKTDNRDLEDELIVMMQEKISHTSKLVNNMTDVISLLLDYINRTKLMASDLISAITQDNFFRFKKQNPNLKIIITYEDLKLIFDHSSQLKQLVEETIKQSQAKNVSRLRSQVVRKERQEFQQKKEFYQLLPDQLSFREYMNLLSPNKEQSFKNAVQDIIMIMEKSYKILNRNNLQPTLENIKNFILNYGGYPLSYDLRADLATRDIYEDFKKFKSAKSLQMTRADVEYFFSDPQVMKQVERTKRLVNEEYARLAKN